MLGQKRNDSLFGSGNRTIEAPQPVLEEQEAALEGAPLDEAVQPPSEAQTPATAFTDADEVIIADIYAARESDDGTISAAMLADRIAKTGKSARYVGDFNAIRSYLEKNCKAGDLLLTVGAGDVFKIGEAFLEN